MALNTKLITQEISEIQQTGMVSDWERWLRDNPNNFSYWFPHIENLREKGICVPHSVIIPISMDLVKPFFMEQEGDREKIMQWIAETVKPSILQRFPSGKVFIKNGCYSGKFRFSENCLITDTRDEESLFNHICTIQYDSFCVESGGNLEIIVREYIEPEPGTPSIYHGMPLRPEIRIFYDFDKHRYLYDSNYWDWSVCHEGIARHSEDGKVYEAAYPSLVKSMEERLAKHQPLIVKALESVEGLQLADGVPNIWSVDFILEDDRVWLIDMALGWMSAYWNPEKAGLKNQ